MAELYGTANGADLYHQQRGNYAWIDVTKDITDRDAARLRASEYIDSAYRASFPGYKTGLRAQLREWPRTGAYDIGGQTIDANTVPLEIEEAVYEAALRELATPGSLNPDYDPSQQARREKVDMLEIEYTAPHGPNSVRPIISIINAIIAPVLTGDVKSSVSGRAERI